MSAAIRASLAAATAALALSGCVGGEGPRGNARQGGSIRIAYGAPPDSLDPAIASTPSAREALWLVYTPPLTYRRAEGRKGTDLIPGLAERLPSVSDEGRSYAFTFRKGLRYSDGRPLRARDFARTLDRVRALRSPGARLFDDVARVTTDDGRRSVRIRLRRPDSAFPYALASTYAGLVPATTPLNARPAKPPPGIGPYAIAGVRPGGGFTLRRKRQFSLPGVPGGNVDDIDVEVVADAGRAARAVLTGTLDYMQDAPPVALLPSLRSKYKDRYGEHRTVSTLAFVFDARRAPFRDVRLRRAASYAVDGRDLWRLLVGRLEPGCTLLPPDVPGHHGQSCPYGDRSGHADLVRARSLVDDAGAAGSRVALRGSSDPVAERLLRYYAGTLRKIGLRARVVAPSGAAAGAAQAWLAERSPDLPYPALFFTLLRADDPLLQVDVERLRLLALDGGTERGWGRLDARAIDNAYAAPFGSERRSTFLSERLDFDNCARFHPVYGNDYSSFCLK